MFTLSCDWKLNVLYRFNEATIALVYVTLKTKQIMCIVLSLHSPIYDYVSINYYYIKNMKSLVDLLHGQHRNH